MSNDKTTNNKETVEYANIDESTDINIKEQVARAIEQSKKQYPLWKPEKAGSILIGYVNNVIGMPNLNMGKGSILLELKTRNEKYPVVSMFSNVVIENQLINISKMECNKTVFESKLNCIKSLIGRTFAFTYNGEIQGKQAGSKPYRDYIIVEI